jgi:hypothetical protein
MAGPNSWMIFATIGFFHFTANVLLTKDVFDHFPFKKERIVLYFFIWAIPFAGAWYVFRKIGLEHYKTHEPGNNATSVGLLGMDEVFNPSARPKVVNEQMLKDVPSGSGARCNATPSDKK